MSQSTIDSPIRASAKSNSIIIWKMQIQWASGVPSLVKLKSDVDVNIGVAASVTDGGSGAIVNLRFPKGNVTRAIGKNLSPASPATKSNYRVHEVTDMSATAGTAKIRFSTIDAQASVGFFAPPDGSIYDLVLLIE